MSMTVKESIELDMIRYGVTQQMALQFLIYDASLLDHTFYSGDGHLIPRSSYYPHKGAHGGTQS